MGRQGRAGRGANPASCRRCDGTLAAPEGGQEGWLLLLPARKAAKEGPGRVAHSGAPPQPSLLTIRAAGLRTGNDCVPGHPVDWGGAPEGGGQAGI